MEIMQGDFLNHIRRNLVKRDSSRRKGKGKGQGKAEEPPTTPPDLAYELAAPMTCGFNLLGPIKVGWLIGSEERRQAGIQELLLASSSQGQSDVTLTGVQEEPEQEVPAEEELPQTDPPEEEETPKRGITGR